MLSQLSLAVVALAPFSAAFQDEIVRPAAQRANWHYEEEPDDPPAPSAARDDAAARSVPLAPALGGFASVQVNVDGSGLNIVGDAANEPSIAVDPTNPERMAIGWRQFDSIASNFRQAGYAWTQDGGATWSAGTLDPGQFRSDPVLVSDAAGRFYYSSLSTISSVEVFRSNDGGASWLNPIPAFGGDKQWIAVDTTAGPGAGFLYQIWQIGAQCCFPFQLTRSINGGSSYQSPVLVDESPTFGTIDVGPDGDVWATGIDGDTFNFSTFVVSHSTNAQFGGLTPSFQGQFVDLRGSMQASTGPNPGGLLGQAWIAVDPSNGPTAGSVYVLASVDPFGPDPMDVHITRSTDDGQTWSTPVRVNDDPGTSAWQWFGTLDVAPDGRLDVVWNDTRGTGATNMSQLYYSWSHDGGVTWAPNVAVTPAWDSFLGWPNQSKIGDYYELVSDATGTNLAYAATFNGEQDVYYVRLTPDCAPTLYCTAKLNSQGCAPAVQVAGDPSFSGGSFTISSAMELNNKNGLLFYGTLGPAAIPFLGGTLCTQPPLRRTPVQNSFGNPPPDDCSGTYTFDFSAWVQSGIDPALVPGAQVQAQFWGRDPAHPDGIGASLTNAVDFELCQ